MSSTSHALCALAEAVSVHAAASACESDEKKKNDSQLAVPKRFSELLR